MLPTFGGWPVTSPQGVLSIANERIRALLPHISINPPLQCDVMFIGRIGFFQPTIVSMIHHKSAAHHSSPFSILGSFPLSGKMGDGTAVTENCCVVNGINGS